MNQNVLLSLLIGLLIGFGGGMFAAGVEPQSHGDEHAHEHDDDHDHGHERVNAEVPYPGITKLEATPDAKGGYNVYFETENFTITPSSVNNENVANQGHAHIFVNEEKISRVYGNWFYVGADHFHEGTNVIEVTLNANDHSEWAIENVSILKEITVTQ